MALLAALEERLGTVPAPWLERGEVGDAAIDRGDVMRFRAGLAAGLAQITPPLRALRGRGHAAPVRRGAAARRPGRGAWTSE